MVIEGTFPINSCRQLAVDMAELVPIELQIEVILFAFCFVLDHAKYENTIYTGRFIYLHVEKRIVLCFGHEQTNSWSVQSDLLRVCKFHRDFLRLCKVRNDMYAITCVFKTTLI